MAQPEPEPTEAQQASQPITTAPHWRERLEHQAGRTSVRGWGDSESRARPIPRERWDQVALLCETIERWGYESRLTPEDTGAVTVNWGTGNPRNEYWLHYSLTLGVRGCRWYAGDTTPGAKPQQGVCDTAREALRQLRERMPKEVVSKTE